LLSPFCAGIKGHAVRGGNICLTEPINIADFCAAGSLRKKNYTMPNPYTTYPIYNFFAMEPNGPRISIVAGAYFLVCPLLRIYEFFLSVSTPAPRQLYLYAVGYP